MKKLTKSNTLSLMAMIFLSLVLLMSYSKTAAAEEDTSRIQHVYDEADLLSTSQLDYIEAMCVEYSKKDNLDIIILTHDDSNAVDGDIYIENFADKMQYGDSVILLVDMYNRDVCLQGFGSAEKKINSSKAQAITEELSPYLSDEEYEVAFKKYIKLTDKSMNYVPLYLNPLIQLAVAAIIGAITVAVMAYNSGGKMTVGDGTYMDQNHSGLIGRRDDYIRTQVTRIRKPQNNGGKGGFGGISAGGLSHSSGRSKF